MMQDNEVSQSSFVPAKLPWLVAASTLALYLVTLNHWVTLTSLPIAAKVAGWDWNSTVPTPLLYLVTFPFRYLSPGLQLTALNFSAALCGALTLALLARSVALLPHDRTREQRTRERSEFSLLSIRTAWLPPLFAVLVCGLELTFWENATAITGEMLNLLLFAYVVRCLLEYRIDQRDSWLWKLAFVYGLATTNNWAMIGFLPAFVIALIWIKGVSFFDFGFLWRMVAFGVAGLLLYLLIPLVEVTSGNTPYSFWQLLKSQLASQKALLSYGPLRNRALVCGLTSLLPVLVMGIRWPSSFGDVSTMGAAVTNFMFKVIHALFLVACTWVAFDMDFSPRKLGLGLPFLTYYYLGALAVGYFSGYFLLVYGSEPKKSAHRSHSSQRLVNGLVTCVVWVGLLAAPAALAYRNWPQIRSANGPALKTFATLAAQELPAGGAVVLSDDSVNLMLLHGVLNGEEKPSNHVLIETQYLPYHIYQKHLAKRYPSRWKPLPLEKLAEPLDSLTNFSQIYDLSQSNAVYYLHPSFGYFFEHFYMQPRGLVYRLTPYPEGVTLMPPMPPDEFTFNQAFWTKLKDDLTRLAAPGLDKLTDADFLARNYSRALNYWGVQLQRNDHLNEARDSFELAKQLNADNVAALVNAEFNENLRTGKNAAVQPDKQAEEKLKSYSDWVSFVRACGPVDEPSFCINLGQAFSQGGLMRQAIQQYLRAIAMKPDTIDPRLQLAEAYLTSQQFDKTMEVIAEMREHKDVRPLSLAQQVNLARLEAWANFSQTNFPAAEKLLRDTQAKYPQFQETLLALSQMHLQAGQQTNALAVLDELLKLTPDNPTALLNKSFIHINLKQYEQAIPLLDQVLAKDPKNSGALLNRGIANFHANKLDAAERDYIALEKLTPNYSVVFYRLAEIANKRGNHKDEIANYKLFLRYATPGTPEIKKASERLKELKAAP